MKKVIRFILAAFAAILFSSCAAGTYGTPIGTFQMGGQGGPSGAFREYQESRQRFAREDREVFEGRGERRLVKGENDYYSKSTWNNDYHPNVEIQVYGRPRDASDDVLRDKIRDWAVEYHKTHDRTPPTNEQATAKAEESRGAGQVRVRLGNSQPSPTFVSRERVMEKDIPLEDRAEFQRRAIEQFNKTGQNKPVTNGKFYNN